MCRILTYLGKPILIEDLLYKTDNSFIKQSYRPQYMSHLLNLAGFGFSAWDTTSYNPNRPFIYKTDQLPFYDENLRNFSAKITPDCFLAHLRGVTYSEQQVVSIQNVHPFIFEYNKPVLAHNGVLFEFEKMKYDLLEYISLKYKTKIKGTTDSEWIYAIFLSQFDVDLSKNLQDRVTHSIIETLKILKKVRSKHKITMNSPINLFISDGNFIAATRFVFDYGWFPLDYESTHFRYHSLWYTYGENYGKYDDEYKMKDSKKKSSVIIASEPLTHDVTSWIEVPEYTLVLAIRNKEEIEIFSHDIHI